MKRLADLVQQTVETLSISKSLFILTGAGVSAESGIPTFRGKDGLWKNYAATDLATPEAFKKDPELVWEWYRWRQGIISKAKPNPAHYAIVELERRFSNFLLLTQNIDNLHSRAGSKNLLELHGNIFKTRCTGCNRIFDYQEGSISTQEQAGALPEQGLKDCRDLLHQTIGLPKCLCGGLLRPDVVWFGEPIPPKIWEDTIQFLRTTDVVIICGTSSIVWPAAGIPGIAKSCGAKTIEINLEPTPLTPLVDIALMGKAAEILPQIVSRLQDTSGRDSP